MKYQYQTLKKKTSSYHRLKKKKKKKILQRIRKLNIQKNVNSRTSGTWVQILLRKKILELCNFALREKRD